MAILKYRLLDQNNGEGGDGGATTILNKEGGDDDKDKGGGGTGNDGGAGAGGDGGQGGGAGGEGDKGGQDWSADWRERIAATVAGKKEGEEYDKELKRLQRFATPDKLYGSYREVERRISSGEFKRPLPDNATPEQIKAWREESGIPVEWSGYYDHMKDIQIGENDKPIFDDFMENVAHPLNMSPASTKQVIDWYYSLQATQQEVRAEEDQQAAVEAEEKLRELWGKDYRPNVGMVNQFINRMPEAIRDGIKNARLPDGKALFNIPEFIQYVVDLEREINPAGAIIPGGDSGSLADIDKEIADIKRKMPTKEYRENPQMQQRYKDLIVARDRLKSR